MAAVLVPAPWRRGVGAFFALAGFITAGIFAGVVFDRSAERDVRGRQRDRRATASARSARSSSAGAGCSRSSCPTRTDARRLRRRVLRAAGDRRRRHVLPAPGAQPDDALPRARVVLDRALHHLRDRHGARDVARVGAQVPRDRLVRLGRAALRLRARLRRDGRDRLRAHRRGRRPARRAAARRAGDDPRRPRLQGVGRSVPPVDSRRLRGRAYACDGVHVRRDEGDGADPDDPRPARGVPAGGAPLDDRGRRARLRVARGRATSPRSCNET